MPPTEHINVNMSCNQNCIFCILNRFHNNKKFTQKDSVDGPSLKEIKKRIDKIRTYTKSISFIGAEPTLRPDLPEMIRYAKKKGFEWIDICSNAVKMADINYAKKLADGGLDVVVTSLHSHKPEVSDQITQIKGSWKRIVRGIKNLFDIGVGVRVTHVICSKNYKDLPEFVKFFKENFPIQRDLKKENISFLFLQSPIVLEEEPEKKTFIKNLMPSFSSIKPYLDAAIKYCKKNGIRFTIEGIPLCFFGDSLKEEIYSVDTIDLVKEDIVFLKSDSEKINYAKKFLDIHSKGMACQFCDLNNICAGPWKEYIQIYGEEGLTPIRNREIFFKLKNMLNLDGLHGKR